MRERKKDIERKRERERMREREREVERERKICFKSKGKESAFSRKSKKENNKTEINL